MFLISSNASTQFHDVVFEVFVVDTVLLHERLDSRKTFDVVVISGGHRRLMIGT